MRPVASIRGAINRTARCFTRLRPVMEDIRLIKDVDGTRRDARQFHEWCAMIIKCSNTPVCAWARSGRRGARGADAGISSPVTMRRNSGSGATGLRGARGGRKSFAHERTRARTPVCVIRFSLRVSSVYGRCVPVVVAIEPIDQ
jgi:hypothetical protein